MNDLVRGLGHAGTWVMLSWGALLFALENALPLRRRTRPRARRTAVNACLTAGVFLIGTFVVRGVALGIAVRAEGASLGLLNLVRLPYWARFSAGFLLMDLSFYYWHRVNHEAPVLWRFHAVHHADPDMDVTTAFRFHWGEALFSTAFRAVQVAFTGVDPATYLAYELVFTCETAFHHSNIRIPVRAERLLNTVIVTPRMHGIHHSTVMEETNSNYSTLFRWWDALHRSLNLGAAQSEVTIGVPAYLGTGDNGLWSLLLMPFLRQRDYWRTPDGSRPARIHGAETPDRNRIQE